MKRIPFLTVLILALLSGCATNSPGRAKNELSNAAKTCAGHTWPNATSHIACLDSVETPVIRKRIPAAFVSFNEFAAKRRYLAEQADIINAKNIEAGKKYRVGFNEAFAILKSNEPKLADTSSTLHKEWVAAKAPLVCKQETAVERTGCIRDILRPIWKRNAPDTIAFFDEFEQKNIALSRKLDAYGSPQSTKHARDYFTQGIKQALADWRENARRDIEDANQQDAAARAQALQSFGNFLAGVAEVTLAVAQERAAAHGQLVYMQ